ncbi:hypothetical protein ACWD3Z_33365 [Streptomyces sp. NPDC002740]
MTVRPTLLTTTETRAFVTEMLADSTVGRAVPLGMSLALREGLRTTVLAALSCGTTTRPWTTRPGA